MDERDEALQACETLAVAVQEILKALETIVGEGELNLGGEALYVRANLDKASAALARLEGKLLNDSEP